MEVYVNDIHGLDDAICTLYLSKRNLTNALEIKIRKICDMFTTRHGYFMSIDDFYPEGEDGDEPVGKDKIEEFYQEFLRYQYQLNKWGTKHTTLLRYIDFSCTVYDIHRGAQDDFDSHARRLDNRIVRSSTRLARFRSGEKSDFYEDKIITMDEAIEQLDITIPDTITHNDKTYVKTINGYILDEYKEDNDVLRGLYMLSIPSTFIFKCNIVEFAHIVALRDKNSTAAPELRDMIEMILTQLEKNTNGFITREFLYEIERHTVR